LASARDYSDSEGSRRPVPLPYIAVVGLFLLSADNIGRRSAGELVILNRFLPTNEKAMLALLEEFDGLFASVSKEALPKQEGGLESRPQSAVLPIVRAWMSRTIQAIDALALTLKSVEANSSNSEEDNQETKKVSVAASRQIQSAKKDSGRTPRAQVRSNAVKRRGKSKT
jgi:hypothetical protein